MVSIENGVLAGRRNREDDRGPAAREAARARPAAREAHKELHGGDQQAVAGAGHADGVGAAREGRGDGAREGEPGQVEGGDGRQDRRRHARRVPRRVGAVG